MCTPPYADSLGLKLSKPSTNSKIIHNRQCINTLYLNASIMPCKSTGKTSVGISYDLCLHYNFSRHSCPSGFCYRKTFYIGCCSYFSTSSHPPSLPCKMSPSYPQPAVKCRHFAKRPLPAESLQRFILRSFDSCHVELKHS